MNFFDRIQVVPAVVWQIFLVFIVMPGSLAMIIGIGYFIDASQNGDGIRQGIIAERDRYSSFDFKANPDKAPYCTLVETAAEPPFNVSGESCRPEPIDAIVSTTRKNVLKKFYLVWILSCISYVGWLSYSRLYLRESQPTLRKYANHRQLEVLPLDEIIAPLRVALESAGARIVKTHTLGAKPILVIIECDLAVGHALSQMATAEGFISRDRYGWKVNASYRQDEVALDRLVWRLEPNDVRLSSFEDSNFSLDEAALRTQFKQMARAFEQRLSMIKASVNAGLSSQLVTGK